MTYVLKLLSLADGTKTAYDGQYLVSYNPEMDGTDPDGNEMQCTIKCTTDANGAKTYPSQSAAWAEWTRTSKRAPVRGDGRPNKPLTAYTVEILPLEQAVESDSDD